MKQEARRHAKIIRAARLLGIDRSHLCGLVNELWSETAVRYPRGDIGRATNEDLALYIDYSGDIDNLIAVLVQVRLLDEIDDGRLYVHDWHDHCEDWVRHKLRAAKKTFANGAPPYKTQRTAEKRSEVTKDDENCRELPRSEEECRNPASPRAHMTMSLSHEPVPTSPLPPSGGTAVAGDDPAEAELKRREVERFNWETVETFLGRTLNHERDWVPFVETLDICARRRSDKPLGPLYIREVAEAKFAEMEEDGERPRWVTPLTDALRDATDEIVRLERNR